MPSESEIDRSKRKARDIQGFFQSAHQYAESISDGSLGTSPVHTLLSIETPITRIERVFEHPQTSSASSLRAGDAVATTGVAPACGRTPEIIDGISEKIDELFQIPIPYRWRVRLPAVLLAGFAANKLRLFSAERAQAQDFGTSNVAPLLLLTETERASFTTLRLSRFGEFVPSMIYPVSVSSVQVAEDGRIEGMITPDAGSALDALLYGTDGSEISLAGTREGVAITLPGVTNFSTFLSETLRINGEHSVSVDLMTDESDGEVKVFPILRTNQPAHLRFTQNGQTQPVAFHANTLGWINPHDGKLYLKEHSGSTLTESVAIDNTPDFSAELVPIGIAAPVHTLSIVEREKTGDRNLHTIMTDKTAVVVGYWDVAVLDGSRLRAAPNGEVAVDKYSQEQNMPILGAEFEFSDTFDQLKQDFPEIAPGQYGLFETHVSTGQYRGTWYLYWKDATHTQVARIHESRVKVTFLNALTTHPIATPEAPLSSADLLARQLGLPEDRTYVFDASVVYGNVRMLKDQNGQVWAASPQDKNDWQTAKTLQESLALDTHAEDGTPLNYYLAGDQGNLFLREKRDATYQRGAVAMLNEKDGTWYNLRDPYEQMLVWPSNWNGSYEVLQGEHFISFLAVSFDLRTDLRIPIPQTDGVGTKFIRVFWLRYNRDIRGYFNLQNYGCSMETGLVALGLQFQGKEINNGWNDKGHEPIGTKGIVIRGRIPLERRELTMWTRSPDFFEQYLQKKDILTQLGNNEVISEPLVFDLWLTDPTVKIHFP